MSSNLENPLTQWRILAVKIIYEGRCRVWLPEGTAINTWLGLPFFWVQEFPNTNFLSSIGMMNPQLLRMCFSIGFAWLKPLSFRLGWEIHRNAQYMVGVSGPLRKELWFQRFMKQSGCHDVQCLVDLPAEELLTAYLSLPGRRPPGDFSQSHWSDLPIREPASYWASHFTWSSHIKPLAMQLLVYITYTHIYLWWLGCFLQDCHTCCQDLEDHLTEWLMPSSSKTKYSQMISICTPYSYIPLYQPWISVEQYNWSIFITRF
jgi:hypothetical protein